MLIGSLFFSSYAVVLSLLCRFTRNTAGPSNGAASCSSGFRQL